MLRPVHSHRALIVSLLLSLLFVTFRVFYFREGLFLFLVWNLFLAAIPYAMALWVESRRLRGRVAGLLLCVLFLPNAPYMITDLFHLRWHGAESIWFDTLLITSFAWNGLLLFFYTLRKLEHVFMQSWHALLRFGSVFILSALSSYGIYIGRYLRFNSWDVLTKPSLLIREIGGHILHPFDHPRTWSMTVAYALFLLIAYYNFNPSQRESVTTASTGQ